MPTTNNIIYIVSDKRSGSTLLENILAKSNEVVSLGEVAMLRNHICHEGYGDKWNWHCSCGKTLDSCGFWSAILPIILKDTTGNNFETKINFDYTSFHALLFGLFPGLFKKKIFLKINNRRATKVVQNIYGVYQAVFKLTRKPFIIDSSKIPAQAWVLYGNTTEIKIKFIFLTRDIRGIAYSKKKSKLRPDANVRLSLKDLYKVWVYKKFAKAALQFIPKENVLQIRYEDLASSTEETLHKIFTFTGMATFEAPKFMELINDHTIGGTPGRFARKEIKLDERWKKYFEQHRLQNFVGNIFNKS